MGTVDAPSSKFLKIHNLENLSPNHSQVIQLEEFQTLTLAVCGPNPHLGTISYANSLLPLWVLYICISNHRTIH